MRRTYRNRGQEQESPFVKVDSYENLHTGVQFQLRGESTTGWYSFIAHVVNDAGLEWVDGYGGAHGIRQFRSFSIDKLKRSRNGLFVTRPTPKKDDTDA